MRSYHKAYSKIFPMHFTVKMGIIVLLYIEISRSMTHDLQMNAHFH